MVIKATGFAVLTIAMLSIFLLDSGSAPQVGSTTEIRSPGALDPTSNSQDGTSLIPSPFGGVVCMSSNCLPANSGTGSEFTLAELPPQTLLYPILDKIGKGDAVALASAAEVLHSCLANHRNRLLVNKAMGLSLAAEVNECESSQLADLVAATESAVKQGFGTAPSLDSNTAMAQLRWLMTRALLDDSNRQLAKLPPLTANASGAVVFSDLPSPERTSSFWKSAAAFANNHGRLDPDIQNVANGLTEILELQSALDSVQ